MNNAYKEWKHAKQTDRFIVTELSTVNDSKAKKFAKVRTFVVAELVIDGPRPLANLRGLPGTRSPLWVQGLSFSCSLQEKIGQIIGWRPTLEVGAPAWEILDPPLEGIVHKVYKSTFQTFFFT